MEAHDIQLNKVPLFARKHANTNILRSAAPKLAFVSASRYNCDLNNSYRNVCAKVH